LQEEFRKNLESSKNQSKTNPKKPIKVQRKKRRKKKKQGKKKKKKMMKECKSRET
jgi:hypothetical protein